MVTALRPTLIHCERCGSDGIVMNRRGQLELCSACGGSGRRLRDPYAPTAGEQPLEPDDLKPDPVKP